MTKALNNLDDNYALFRRLKVGSGRMSEYRPLSEAGLSDLRASNEVIWENHRYGNAYVVDRPSLVRSLSEQIPILHLGQVEAIRHVKDAVPHARWLVVYLSCPREVAEQRIKERATGDTTERLRAWDETEPLEGADMVIDTSVVEPDDAARKIARLITEARDRG
ncbi:hypothetical protein [Bailinhaonella thermotolerans]|uniref:hypothetical protein n=1 Tax=Bailinhaonella thermotolerans TaxID=1070861 RepID=UPI00192A2855|nr:hypothetical protein [Bailinhaonella thermotolerans]